MMFPTEEQQQEGEQYAVVSPWASGGRHAHTSSLRRRASAAGREDLEEADETDAQMTVDREGIRTVASVDGGALRTPQALVKVAGPVTHTAGISQALKDPPTVRAAVKPGFWANKICITM